MLYCLEWGAPAWVDTGEEGALHPRGEVCTGRLEKQREARVRSSMSRGGSPDMGNRGKERTSVRLWTQRGTLCPERNSELTCSGITKRQQLDAGERRGCRGRWYFGSEVTARSSQ